MKNFAAFCGFLALFSVSLAMAQVKPQTDDIKKLQELGGKILYLGKVHDLYQWQLVSKDGKTKRVLYVTPAGALVEGKVYNPDGTPAGTTKPKSEKFFEEVSAAKSVIIGNAGTPAIYVFVNLSSPDTIKLWDMLKQDVDAGKMHLRIVPLGKDIESRKRAVALLGSKHPRRRWDEEMAGKVEAVSELPEKLLDEVLSNTALARQWELPAFPFIIYRKQTDGNLMTFAGLPQPDDLPQ